MPRFAVLAHDWPEPHFDLFLEAGSTLQSWKLPADFSPPARSSILLGAPHRLLYLDYEGPVSGGRGSVKRWDGGTFEWIHDRESHLEIQLHGHILSGRVLLDLDGVWHCEF